MTRHPALFARSRADHSPLWLARSTTMWVGLIPDQIAREKKTVTLKQAFEYYGAVLSVQIRIKPSTEGGKSWALITWLDATCMATAITVNNARTGSSSNHCCANAKVLLQAGVTVPMNLDGSGGFVELKLKEVTTMPAPKFLLFPKFDRQSLARFRDGR